MAARRNERCYETRVFSHFLVCKGRITVSNDDVGVARGTVFQDIQPGDGFQNGRYRQGKVGGATVERLSRTVKSEVL